MKYAVVAFSGQQFKVSEGELIEVPFQKELKAQDPISFEEVLLVVDGGKREVGTPVVSGVKVTGTVVDHAKKDKIRVSKFKAKVRYRRVTGFRAKVTTVKIEKIA